MSSKEKDAYKAVFEKIKEIWPEWEPTEFHTDFEEGLQNGIEEIFVGVNVIGCFFHFDQVGYTYF